MKIVKRPHGHFKKLSAGKKPHFTSYRIALPIAQIIETNAIKAGVSFSDTIHQILEDFAKKHPAPKGIKPVKTLKGSKHAREDVKPKVKAKAKAKPAKKAKVAKAAKVKAKSGVKTGGKKKAAKKKAAPILAAPPKPERRKADKRVRKVKAAVEKAAEALDAAKEHLSEKAETPAPNGATSEHHEAAAAQF